MTKRDLEFTEADTKKFVPAARKVIAFARLMGWSVRWSNVNHHILNVRSPSGAKVINIPTTNVNANRIQSWVNQLLTHTDPKAVLNLIQGGYDMVKEPDIAEVVATFGTELQQKVEQWEQEDQHAMVTAIEQAMNEAEKVAEQRRRVRIVPTEPEVETVSEDEQKEAPVPAQRTRTIVSERPWLARSGGTAGGQGKVYESQGVMVITYDDGTEAYKCRFCDFTHPTNPRSVKMHAANKKAHDPTHQGIPPKVLLHTDHYEPTDEKRPGRTAIAHLRNDLVLALDSIEGWRDMDSPELADLAAHIIVEARPERNVDTTQMTPEQVLARITMLVDGGRIADLHHQVESLSAALAEAISRADKATGNLQALREMLTEE